MAGGQGAGDSAELMAQAAISEDKYAQAFPRFGPEEERAGARFRQDKQGPAHQGQAEVANPTSSSSSTPACCASLTLPPESKKRNRHYQHYKRHATIRKELKNQRPLAVVDATAIARQILGVP